jgi:hypothetical protein
MDYRALLLVALTVTAPAAACADDAGVPPQPERDYSRCGMMRSMPDWCRDRPEQERERQRVRVRTEDETGR